MLATVCCPCYVFSIAGKTVLVSGGTLAACFVGIAFFPLELIKTTGIGAVVAVIFTMGSALTLGLFFVTDTHH